MSPFPLSKGNISLLSVDLSLDEGSAVCYVEGNMIWSLQEKIVKKSQSFWRGDFYITLFFGIQGTV